MLIGLTDNLRELNRISILRRIGKVTTAFSGLLFLPLIIYLLFYFNIVNSRQKFTSDVQEPVAKVVTDLGVGTAFLINATTLITARHVVENKKIGEEVDLIFDRSKNKFHTKATVKFIASPSATYLVDGSVSSEYFLSDVAILEVSRIDDIEPLVLGESDLVQNLDDVIVIGYPNGDYSITKGNINSDKYQGLDLFKLDATSNPGNSGGPCILVDDSTVIGILVGGSSTARQGENIALKINDVKRILNDAKIIF